MVPYLTSNRVIASDQMIRNLSMKIGEVDSGSARLLCAAEGGESCLPPITRIACYKPQVDILLVDLHPVELITE